MELKIALKLIWVPGHANIHDNENADKAAKAGARILSNNSKELISDQVLFGWVKEKVKKRWQEMWQRSESGVWTKSLINHVGKKRSFPRDRNSGVSFVRALLNNAAVADNMFRMGLDDSCECSCGQSRETVEHVLMECIREDVIRKKLREGMVRLKISGWPSVFSASDPQPF